MAQKCLTFSVITGECGGYSEQVWYFYEVVGVKGTEPSTSTLLLLLLLHLLSPFKPSCSNLGYGGTDRQADRQTGWMLLEPRCLQFQLLQVGFTIHPSNPNPSSSSTSSSYYYYYCYYYNCNHPLSHLHLQLSSTAFKTVSLSLSVLAQWSFRTPFFKKLFIINN